MDEHDDAEGGEVTGVATSAALDDKYKNIAPAKNSAIPDVRKRAKAVQRPNKAAPPPPTKSPSTYTS